MIQCGSTPCARSIQFYSHVPIILFAHGTCPLASCGNLDGIQKSAIAKWLHFFPPTCPRLAKGDWVITSNGIDCTLSLCSATVDWPSRWQPWECFYCIWTTSLIILINHGLNMHSVSTNSIVFRHLYCHYLSGLHIAKGKENNYFLCSNM